MKIEKVKRTHIIPKKFKTFERHIRYNFEESPESTEDRGLVRYHFIISDDRFREEKLERIFLNFQKKSITNYPFEEIRKVEGKHKETDFRFLFVSYDTEYTPKFLSFEGISKNIKRDGDLRERKVGSIEDYVIRIYEHGK